KDLSKDPEVQKLQEQGVRVFQEQSLPKEKFDLAISSSGIPRHHQALALGDLVLGEAEFALREAKTPCIAITGTNGKTTVTLLVEHVLNKSGRRARALGNVGDPLAGYFLQPREEVLVVELSSYQLETLTYPAFQTGCILNITPDHLDRYASMQEYARAKARLQHCLQKQGAFFVCEKALEEYPSLFSEGTLPLQVEKAKSLFSSLSSMEHEQCNALAAWELCSQFGVNLEQFIQAWHTFRKPHHRIEFVQEVRGVAYYDDSKGTNIDAVIKAVHAITNPVILIVGGVDKGSSYLPWREAFTGRVKQLFVLGQAAKKISSELALFFNLQIVDSLEEAVLRASQVAVAGDAVLLSPGCSSLDMFRDYAHRGREFQKFVRGLEEK
ncbi:MAG: UDP-N-acetylmuramoyl-L-alanine--D-glutamate ligase, partial [Chlamydiae bacterium]|nr:UDP-N-acetylmuramoyl-L-alanine--D-glutamate ligase [Chlamydiota bacterium]